VRRSFVSLSIGFVLLVTGAATAGPSFGADAAVLPPGFHAQSMSWVSPSHGWMLGSASCARGPCTAVVGTIDGGGTWTTLGTVAAPVTIERATGVTEVRFADDLHGWAFEPALYATRDGGITWHRQATPGGGHLIMALAADAEAAYAVVSPCRLNQSCDEPATLWRTIPGQTTWTQVPVQLPVVTGFDTAVLAVHGSVAYLAVPSALDGVSADVLDVTVDGQQWLTRPDPCSPKDGETLTGLAPINDSSVALLCQGNIGFGKAAKLVLLSDDNGLTTRSTGEMSLWGITSQVAATPSGTLVVASYSIGSWIYRNADGTSWTTQVDLGDGGMGWNDLVFTTDEVGFVIHGPASCCGGSGPGELWETTDGGLTWAPV
jgi:hypothetical protein